MREESEDDLPQEEVVKPMQSMEINGSRMVMAGTSSFGRVESLAEDSVGSGSEQKGRRVEYR